MNRFIRVATQLITGILMILYSGIVLLSLVSNSERVFLDYRQLVWVWGGVISYIVAKLIRDILSRYLFKGWLDGRFISTFTHELTHTIFALLFFKRVSGFHVKASGEGNIELSKTVNPLIILSPYSIPIYTIILLTARVFVAMDIYLYLDLVIGFTYAFHIHTFTRSARPQQTDIQRYSIFFSYSFILFINTIMMMIIFVSLRWGFMDSIGKIWSYCEKLFHLIYNIFTVVN